MLLKNNIELSWDQARLSTPPWLPYPTHTLPNHKDNNRISDFTEPFHHLDLLIQNDLLSHCETSYCLARSDKSIPENIRFGIQQDSSVRTEWTVHNYENVHFLLTCKRKLANLNSPRPHKLKNRVVQRFKYWLWLC